jgi:hypothetical protein
MIVGNFCVNSASRSESHRVCRKRQVHKTSEQLSSCYVTLQLFASLIRRQTLQFISHIRFQCASLYAEEILALSPCPCVCVCVCNFRTSWRIFIKFRMNVTTFKILPTVSWCHDVQLPATKNVCAIRTGETLMSGLRFWQCFCCRFDSPVSLCYVMGNSERHTVDRAVW